MARRIAVLLGLVGLGCQTYDFERVEPAAFTFQIANEQKVGTNLRPNVVVLLDRSGSMAQPINPADPACPATCQTAGLPCPATCATRVTELRSAMDTFFSGPARDFARWGLAVYPANPQGDQCSETSAFLEPLPTASMTDDGASRALWQEGADRVKAAIHAMQPGGGTPTAASLSFLGGAAGLLDATDHRADFVLLLTDGLPNCNGANPHGFCGVNNTPAQQQACACTMANCGGDDLCSRGCLDEDASVTAVRALKAKGISTLVVGFGADTANSTAARVLNAMALEGGAPRSCTKDTDCGGDGCSEVGLCRQAFFHASSAGELTGVLRQVIERIGRGDPCAIELGGTLTDPIVSVRAEDTWYQQGPNTWVLTGTTVKLQGTLCERARAATPANPLNIEVRVVERL